MTSSPKLVYIPWSEDQVDSLNAYQSSNAFHGYTCGRCSGVLIAARDGWHCPDVFCRYQQDWAWPYTANWEWKKMAGEMLNIFDQQKGK